jgi:predicted phosphodiesterase
LNEYSLLQNNDYRKAMELKMIIFPRIMEEITKEMRVQVITDIHVDLEPSKLFQIQPKAPVLIVCGDLMTYEEVAYEKALAHLKQLFQKVIIVFGNHECMGFPIDQSKYIAMKHTKDNVVVLDHQHIGYNGFRFFGGTMWSDTQGEELKWPIQNSAGTVLNPSQIGQLHQQALNELNKCILLSRKDKIPLVVISHFCPILEYSVEDEAIMMTASNHQYAFDGARYLNSALVHTWLYGHTHVPRNELIQGCRVVNPHRQYDFVLKLHQPKFKKVVSAPSLRIEKRLLRKVEWLPMCLPTTGSAFANWVLPHKLQVGIYPFTDGWNLLDVEAGQENLRLILQDGINGFVCLQQEIPIDKYKNGELVTTDYEEMFPVFHFYGHYLPTDQTIDILHFAIEDGSVPKSISRFVVFLKSVIRKLATHNLYLHCAGGRGRTTVVCACLLLYLYKELDADFVLDYLFTVRLQRRKKDLRMGSDDSYCVLNSVQLQFVRDFKRWTMI